MAEEKAAVVFVLVDSGVLARLVAAVVVELVEEYSEPLAMICHLVFEILVEGLTWWLFLVTPWASESLAIAARHRQLRFPPLVLILREELAS